MNQVNQKTAVEERGVPDACPWYVVSISTGVRCPRLIERITFKLGWKRAWSQYKPPSGLTCKVSGVRQHLQTNLMNLCEGERVHPAKQRKGVNSLRSRFTTFVLVYKKNLQIFYSQLYS